MPSIQILSTGRMDERDSAFPQSVCLPGGDLLCSFGVGGGQFVHGGTDFCRSTDGGEHWTLEGTILPPTTDPPSANFLKLSLSADGRTIYAYGTRFLGPVDDGFGERVGETVLCRSTDEGRTWSEPQVIAMPGCEPECPLEVSHSLRPLESGRLLAPAALLQHKDRLGEEVFVAASNDNGQTWPARHTVFRDPAGKLGFWEQKFVNLGDDHLLATAWTVTLGDYQDQPDSFTLSSDGGRTWNPHRSTGIAGQTLTPHHLGDDRLLVLYNRRHGQQGIVAALVTFTPEGWTVHHESQMFDARNFSGGPEAGNTGVDELASFQFGFPTAVRLPDDTWLATHWSVEGGNSGIRWTKLAIDWPTG